MDNILGDIGAVFPKSGGNLVENLPQYFRLALLIVTVLAVIFVMIGGIKYITAGGDDGKAKGARKTIINALIGMVISFLAWGIVQGVYSVVTGSSDFLS